MTDNRANIYAAMLDDDDEIEAADAAPVLPDSTSLYVAIEVGGSQITVPTAEYARRLERTVGAQANTIRRLERWLARLSATVRTQRGTINLTTSRMSDLGRDLDQKIDRRD